MMSTDSLTDNYYPHLSCSINGCTTERSKASTILLVGATITDVIIVIGLAGLEYMLKWRNLFPIRNRLLPPINQSCVPQRTQVEPYKLPVFQDIPEILIYIYSFSFPILIIVIGELLLFALANPCDKPLPLGNCSAMRIPHTIRRLYRFSLTFLFGILALMCCIDCLKCALGVLRPCAIDICSPNQSYCNISSNIPRYTDNMDKLCRNTNKIDINKARTSCPSMRAGISMYSAIFVGIYIYGVGVVHHCKYLLPALIVIATVMMSLLLGGVMLVANGYNTWIDVIVGHMLGAIMSFYLGFCILRGFRYQESVSKRRLLRQIIATKCARKRDIQLKSNQYTQDPMESFINPSTIMMDSPVRLRRSVTNGGTITTFFPESGPIITAVPMVTRPMSRKSVTLPIRSPHLPSPHTNMTTTTTNTVSKFPLDNRLSMISLPPATSFNHANRLSMINIPPPSASSSVSSDLRNMTPSKRIHSTLLSTSNLPTISQELVDLLNEKQHPAIPSSTPATTTTVAPTSTATSAHHPLEKPHYFDPHKPTSQTSTTPLIEFA